MLDRVFFHIGQPKTGTTYLQDVVWSHRDQLREEGLVLPGTGHREHLWAALDVQQRPGLAGRHPRAVGTWERLCTELDDLDGGDALLTHEFFCGATADQARDAVERLPAREVHLVLTVRHAAALLSAGWQEAVKNGAWRDLWEVDGDRRRSEFTWRTWDLARVLKRWGPTVPADRVHVVPVPGAGADADEHWRRFASVLGLRGDYALPERPANPSLGAVEVELLRRVNRRLSGFENPTDRGTWIRGYLAEERLRELSADRRFGLPDDLLAGCRTRSERAVSAIVEHGYHVVGELDEIRVPEDLPRNRQPGTVGDDELVDTATQLVAAMLGDVRDLHDRLDRAEAALRESERGRADDAAGAAAAAQAVADARPVRRLRRAAGRLRGGVRDRVRPPGRTGSTPGDAGHAEET